ncbi:MAG TPA: CHAD domain-containing protein [Trichormus sp.]|jgi:CHAD domain-containing protein
MNYNSNNNVPPHLNQRSWLEFEEETASALCESVSRELKRLSIKTSAKRVHDTRVALRRWDSVWNVLERDGWATKKYWKQVGKDLKTLRKLLGDLRDWDVNLETGRAYGLPQLVLTAWREERGAVAKKVRGKLKHIDMDKLVKRLQKFIRTRPYELRREIAEQQLRRLAETAYAHLEPFLFEHEEEARKLEEEASNPPALHKLRLSIKAWRYFLTEFLGLTNLQLVRAQQILGKYNDLIRIHGLLVNDERFAELAKDVIERLSAQSEEHMKEFSDFRKALPYGLRPEVISHETGE